MSGEMKLGGVSDLVIEREENISFSQGVDENENPAFYWVNPWTGRREKVAIFFWPEHPFEYTEKVEALWEHLELRIAPQHPLANTRAGLSEVTEALRTINDNRGGAYESVEYVRGLNEQADIAKDALAAIEGRDAQNNKEQ